MRKDPLEEALEKIGVRLEKKDVSPVTQMLASGVGGIGGQVAGAALNLGTIGKAVLGLVGAVAGHVAVTYRVRFEKPKSAADEEQIDKPETPMAFSDRR